MKKNNITNILSSSELILCFVLVFIMFTTPLVVDVLLSIKFDVNLKEIEGMQIEKSYYVYAYAKAMLLELLVMVLLVNGYKKTSIAFTLTTGIVSLYFYNQFNFADGFPKHSIEVIYSFMFPLVTAICSHIYIERKENENRIEEQSVRIETEKVGKLEEENRIKSEQIKRLSEINGKQTEELNEKDQELSLVQETLEEVHSQGEKIRKQNRRAERELRRKTENERKKSEKLKEVSVDAQKWREATTCKYCGHSVKSPQGLNAHQSKCAKNPKNMKKNVEQLEIKESE